MVGYPSRLWFWGVVSMQINGENSVFVLLVWAKGRLAAFAPGIVRGGPGGDAGVWAEELRF